MTRHTTRVAEIRLCWCADLLRVQGLPVDAAARKRMQDTYDELHSEKETAFSFLGLNKKH